MFPTSYCGGLFVRCTSIAGCTAIPLSLLGEPRQTTRTDRPSGPLAHKGCTLRNTIPVNQGGAHVIPLTALLSPERCRLPLACSVEYIRVWRRGRGDVPLRGGSGLRAQRPTNMRGEVWVIRFKQAFEMGALRMGGALGLQYGAARCRAQTAWVAVSQRIDARDNTATAGSSWPIKQPVGGQPDASGGARRTQ